MFKSSNTQFMYFRHEYQLCEKFARNKNNKIKRHSSTLAVTSGMCVLIRHTFCESLVKIYAKSAHLCDIFFSDIGQCFHTVTKRNSIRNQKSVS